MRYRSCAGVENKKCVQQNQIAKSRHDEACTLEMIIHGQKEVMKTGFDVSKLRELNLLFDYKLGSSLNVYDEGEEGGVVRGLRF